MSTATLPHPLFASQDTQNTDADFFTLTNVLLESAAHVESHVHDLERRLTEAIRDQRRAQQRSDCARAWIAAIRKSHRRSSHARTAQIIRLAVSELTTTDGPKFPYPNLDRSVWRTS